MANTLSGHPEVIAVEAEDHQGVHESVFFSHFAREYGDLSNDENFRRFVKDFTASDYFLLSGISKEWFTNRRPRSYPEAFQSLMDEMVRQREASFWVEKSPHHTLLSQDLAEAFPRARFVCVIRDPLTLIRSRIWAFGRTPPPYPRRLSHLLRASAAVSLSQRHLVGFQGKNRQSLLVRYEEMREDLEGTMKRVMAFVGGEFDPAMLVRRFRPNTSFHSGSERQTALLFSDRVIIRLAMAALSLVPLRWLRRMEERRRLDRGVDWPPWCWKRQPRPSSLNGEGTHCSDRPL